MRVRSQMFAATADLNRHEIFPDQKVFPGQSKITIAGARGPLERRHCCLPGGCLVLGDGAQPPRRSCQSPGFACMLRGKPLPLGMGGCPKIKGKRERQGKREKERGEKEKGKEKREKIK